MTSSSCSGTTPPAQVPPPASTAGCSAASAQPLHYIRERCQWVRRPRAATAGTRAFGRGDQLQQFLRIIQPLFEFRAQSLGGNLRRDGYIGRARVSGHKFDFIDPDCGLFVVPERILDLL